MDLQLTGVLVNRVKFAPGVPTNTAQTLTLPQTSSANLSITVVRSDGTPVDLTAAGTFVVLTVKRSLAQGPSLRPGFQKSAALTTPGHQRNVIVIPIAPSDTASLAPARYVYDVWLYLADGSQNQIVALSPFIVTPALNAPAPPGVTVVTPTAFVPLLGGL